MNQFSDYVYKHMYGDKDTFHICWRLCGHEVCVPTKFPGWHVVAFLQKDFAGNPLFIHRTRDKFRLTGHIDGLPVNLFYMTRQSSAEVRFIQGLPHEQFGHDCLRECDEHLRPENIFKFVDGRGGWCREVWRQVYTLDEYRLPAAIPNGSIVLDIGAHVGAFTRLALRRGAGHVFAYEPLTMNVELLRYNIGDVMQRVTVVDAAVWKKPGEGLPATIDVGRSNADIIGNTSTASVFSAFDPETVRAVDFDRAIEQAAAASPDGRVYLMKIDAEGAEFPCLLYSESLHLVDRICGEIHSSTFEELSNADLADRLLGHLRAVGYTVETFANGPATLLFWAHRS